MCMMQFPEEHTEQAKAHGRQTPWQVGIGFSAWVWPGPCGDLGPQLAVNLIQVRPPPLRLHLTGQGVRSVRARSAGATHDG